MLYISMNKISVLFLVTLVVGYMSKDVEGLRRPRLIGGLPTKPREIKYLVAIYHNDDFICGGGIIGQKYILTAAHCFVDRTNQFKQGKFKIIAGSDNLKVKTPSTIENDVKKVYVPSIYNVSLLRERYEGDIAVLELKNKLNLRKNANLQKLNLLPRVRNVPNDIIYKSVSAVIAGFGADNLTYFTDEDNNLVTILSSSQKLLRATVQIVDSIVCEEKYLGFMWNSTICGRVTNYLDDTPQGMCQGDSGSPLVQFGTTVIGVASGSTSVCNSNVWPGAYTEVASFKKFINDAKQGITDNMRVQIL